MSEQALPKWIADHIKLYLTQPEKAHLWDASLGGGSGMIPTLLLVTKGAKTGKERMLPLIYKKIDGNYVIVASKGGAPSDPGWFRNLQAHPECEIRVASDSVKVRARVAEGEERQRLWQDMVALYAPYTQYQERTKRQIPVVVLEPR